MNHTLADTWFENAPMGQRLRLLTLPTETAGESFVLEYFHKPFTGKLTLPTHFHPTWTETFEVLEGHARCRVGATELEVASGTRVTMPPGVPHVHPWSASDKTLHVRHTAVSNPADERGLTASLQVILTISWLSGQGRVNRRGAPNPLQLAVLAETTIPATFVPGLPVGMQRLLIPVVAATARALGYRAIYPGSGVVPKL